jgi:CIC family chloride channel protein
VTSKDDPARLLRLSALAGVTGLLAGGAAWVLVHSIALLTNVALFHRVGWTLPSLRHFHPDATTVVVAVAGAGLVALLAMWAPVIRGHGIPEAMDAILTRESRIAPRTAIAKPLSAAIAIGTGGPFGAEGPIIVTGGAIGSLLGQVLHVSASERKILLASGAAAGMAATFGSPLAAVVLAIELLLFEFSARAFIPLVVATSVAGGVHAAVFGAGPLFHVPAHHFSGLGALPLFVVLGLVCGLLATLIAKGLFLVEGLYRRLPGSDSWHPMIGAALFASLGLLVPRALGVGYDVIDDALAGRLALGTLALIAVGKLVIWWIALGSGTSGGTLAPILIISSTTGGIIGELVDQAIPGAHISPGTVALVAMAATFGAATRAPFAAIVFVFELTRDYDAILPLMLATVTADLLARTLLEDSLMTEKLSRRGVRVPGAYHADPMRTALVADVMTTDPDALAGASASTESDAIEALRPSDTLALALQRMLDTDAERLPVVLDGTVVGACSRDDVLDVRRRQMDHEEPQPGWLHRLRPSEG